MITGGVEAVLSRFDVLDWLLIIEYEDLVGADRNKQSVNTNRTLFAFFIVNKQSFDKLLKVYPFVA